MRRLLGLAVIALAVAVAARGLLSRRAAVESSSNGHSSDEPRVAMLRERIAAAHRTVRGETDIVLGE